MKEFKFIVKVTPNHPEKALEKLGEVVEKDKTAFQAVDLDFVRKCYFITAVPIEIALTTDLRMRNLYFYPDLRFIVTGVPASRVQNLIEFGYLVLTDFDLELPENNPKEEAVDGQEGKGPEESDENPRELEEFDENPKEEDEDRVKQEEHLPAPEEKPAPTKAQYFINGLPATEEDFKVAHEKFKKKIEEFGFSSNFRKWLLNL